MESKLLLSPLARTRLGGHLMSPAVALTAESLASHGEVLRRVLFNEYRLSYAKYSRPRNRCVLR